MPRIARSVEQLATTNIPEFRTTVHLTGGSELFDFGVKGSLHMPGFVPLYPFTAYLDYVVLGGTDLISRVRPRGILEKLFITGDDSDNTIDGTKFADIISGGKGNDTLSGLAGDDRLSGGDGDDRLFGGPGNDLLAGGAGADTMVGGTGNDRYVVNDDTDVVIELPNEGYDTVSSFVQQYTLPPNVEELVLGSSAVNGFGNELDNRIVGNDAANILSGLDGDDFIIGGGGADYMIGGNGNDQFVVDDPGDQVVELVGGGHDTITAFVDYKLAAGAEVELLQAAMSVEDVPISLTGNAFWQTIVGNRANNIIDGGGGGDWMQGGSGDDTYYVSGSDDRVYEFAGGGFDKIAARVSYSLLTNEANTGSQQEIEVLSTADPYGTASIDLTGDNSSNWIVGNNGMNSLRGEGGNDVILGYQGADRLAGGLGNDFLTGGDGDADQFVFDTALNPTTNVDRIMDFDPATDTILLDHLIFTSLAPGALTADQFYIGSAAGDGADRIIYDSATGALLYDHDGGGGTAAIQFATLNKGLALTHADFEVF